MDASQYTSDSGYHPGPPRRQVPSTPLDDAKPLTSWQLAEVRVDSFLRGGDLRRVLDVLVAILLQGPGRADVERMREEFRQERRSREGTVCMAAERLQQLIDARLSGEDASPPESVRRILWAAQPGGLLSGYSCFWDNPLRGVYALKKWAEAEGDDELHDAADGLMASVSISRIGGWAEMARPAVHLLMDLAEIHSRGGPSGDKDHLARHLEIRSLAMAVGCNEWARYLMLPSETAQSASEAWILPEGFMSGNGETAAQDLGLVRLAWDAGREAVLEEWAPRAAGRELLTDFPQAAGVLRSYAGYSVNGMAAHRLPRDPLKALVLDELHFLCDAAPFPEEHRQEVFDWYCQERSVRGIADRREGLRGSPARALLLKGLEALTKVEDCREDLRSRAALVIGLVCADTFSEALDDEDPRPPCRHHVANAYTCATGKVRVILRQITSGAWPCKTAENRVELVRVAEEAREECFGAVDTSSSGIETLTDQAKEHRPDVQVMQDEGQPKLIVEAECSPPSATTAAYLAGPPHPDPDVVLARKVIANADARDRAVANGTDDHVDATAESSRPAGFAENMAFRLILPKGRRVFLLNGVELRYREGEAMKGIGGKGELGDFLSRLIRNFGRELGVQAPSDFMKSRLKHALENATDGSLTIHVDGYGRCKLSHPIIELEAPPRDY